MTLLEKEAPQSPVLIRALNRLSRKEEERPPELSKTEQLLTEIRDQLKSR